MLSVKRHSEPEVDIAFDTRNVSMTVRRVVGEGLCQLFSKCTEPDIEYYIMGGAKLAMFRIWISCYACAC